MSSVNNESCWVEELDKTSTADSDAVEKSPDGRYLRFNEILGRGAFKNVYKGFDEIDGIEVAWNQVSLEDVPQSPEDPMRLLYSEVYLLKTLKHENVIRSYASWMDDKSKTINIITELFTSGNLRQYRNKHKSVDMKAIKNWARQILRGLDYLHSHEPPIIHRDLKCDNIFVNGNHGEVKIGDLGLATTIQQPTTNSVIVGTPEFMAPELYEEDYDKLVDIYSFGMCMLELVTCEYPYSECKNQAQIYKKVVSGIKPAALGKINDPEVRSFIEKCLVPASRRSTAADLLNTPFLSCEHPADYSLLQLSDFAPTKNSLKSECPSMDLDPSCKMLSGSTCESMMETSVSGLELHRCNERYEFLLKGEKCDDNSISLILRITDNSGQVRNIDFMFFLNADTASSVAVEMVETLDLWQVDAHLIAELINSMIDQLVSRRGSSLGSLHTENNVTSGVGEASKRDTHSELTNAAAPILLQKSSSQHIDPSAPNAILKKDLLVTDYSVEKNVEQSLMGEGLKNSGSSYAGSWITASSDMSLSISALSLTEKERELCGDLKLELDEINLQYQERCRELMRAREAAIENAKKRWLMKKVHVL